MKKLYLILICFLVFIFLFGCTKKEEKPTENETTVSDNSIESDTESKTEREIKIGYIKGKSLNPYKTNSASNRMVLNLVYDGLFTMEDDYTASELIASSFTNEGNRVIVHLEEKAVFQNGDPITAADVIYSFNCAKKNSYYSERLKNFRSAKASDSAVIFELKRSDIFAENSLTFPIIKSGTLKNNYPIGSGRYSIKKDENGLYLSANDKSTRNEEMTSKEIRLIEISAEKGELYLLQTGDLTCFYDDFSKDGPIKINANGIDIPLNNLLFLAFNNNSALLKNKNVRKAIEKCINKTSICDEAYSNKGRICSGVFNPNFKKIESDKDYSEKFNVAEAGDILQKAGYVFAYSHNKVRSKNYKFLELKMLVNEESAQKVRAAKLISKSLKSAGIGVNLSVLPFEEYQNAIKSSSFDLYLGEATLSPNMDLSPFFEKDGSLSYGIDTSGAAAKSYFDFSSGAIDHATFMKVFSSEKPFIPILYRNAAVYFSRELSFEGSVNQYDIFKNAYTYEIKS